MTHRSARAAALAVAVLTVPVGLAARRVLEGQLANVVGVALWTVVVAALVMALAPRLSPWRLFVVAGAIGVAVELFQLTGIPQALYQRHRLFALVLGTSFQASDLPAYLLGAGIAAGGLAVARRHEPEQPG